MVSPRSLITYVALSFLAITPIVQGLGINCRGSSQCGNTPKSVAQDLTNFINNINSDRWYNDDEIIGCGTDNICAYLKGTGGASGQKIKEIAHYIPEHKCKVCGSVPYLYPDENDDNNGMLTYNYVTNPPPS
jgi:hypothetical protein